MPEPSTVALVDEVLNPSVQPTADFRDALVGFLPKLSRVSQQAAATQALANVAEIEETDISITQKMVGFKMTLAKQAIFILQDGVDKDDGTPLVKITEGSPRPFESYVRLPTGVPDIRERPMWEKWAAIVRIQFDGDVFTLEDVTNLLARAGGQVGIGEGRPFSKKSHGMGWGTFEVRQK